MPSLPEIKKKTFLFLLLTFVIFFGVWSAAALVRKRGEVPLQELEKGEPGKEELTGELVSGFPDFPVYPGAAVKTSRESTGGTVGFETVWEVNQEVPEIMRWYMDMFAGDESWKIKEPPDSPESPGEQSAIVSRDNWDFYLTVEREIDAETSEIIVEVVPQRETNGS